MAASRKLSFYRASILSPWDDKRADYWPDGVIVTQPASKTRPATITDILPYNEACERYVEDFARSNLYEYPDSLIIPGFFDMHFHWVQDDVRLMPKDSLLEWLAKYTFPTEAKYASKSYAKTKARKFFQRLLSVGTIGGACYSSIHDHALDEAFNYAQGDLLIGNVLMTQESPAALAQTPKQALGAALRGMKRYKKRYVLTPRFAIATDPATMARTALEADRRGIFKQTHLSETPAEIDFVLKLYKKMKGFERVKSYTELYHKVGMLGERSLMGHAIHLKPAELKLLKKTNTALVHCPTSNAPLRQRGLGSGLFDYQKVEKQGIRWALGSDIGGGPFLSMLDVMDSFLRQHKKAGRGDATALKALYRATLAGAEILGVDERTGSLAPGKEASFVVLRAPAKRYRSGEAHLRAVLAAVKDRAHFDRCVRATFLAGKQVSA